MFHFDYQAYLVKTIEAIGPLKAKEIYLKERKREIRQLTEQFETAKANGDKATLELQLKLQELTKKTKIIMTYRRLNSDGSLGKRKRQ